MIHGLEMDIPYGETGAEKSMTIDSKPIQNIKFDGI
jgi:hypothetical protein